MRKRRSKFDLPTLRLRAKKAIKKKTGKVIKLRDFDKLWADWVNYAVIRPMLDGKKVQLDNTMTIEIVGRRIIDDASMFNLLSKGVNLTRNGIKKPAVEFARNRQGIFYKIEVKDSLYKKGVIIFKSDADLAKIVHDKLKNTQQYFRIEK